MPNIVSLFYKSDYYDLLRNLITFAFIWLNGQRIIHRTYLFYSSEVFRLARDTFFIPLSWTKMRQTVFLPVALIKKANDQGWLRSLAYFVRLKSLYKNNTHYGFTLRSLAAKAKCSPGCLSHHLKKLEFRGLIRYHGDNITFPGLNKLKENNKPATIGVPVEFKNQYDILRGQIIRFNLTAQEYNIKKSGTQIQRTIFVKETKTEKTSSCYIGLSAFGVGNLFCLSGATGSRIRKKLNKLGLLGRSQVFSILYENCDSKCFLDMLHIGCIPIYSKYRNGRVIVERRNRVWYRGAVSVLQ